MSSEVFSEKESVYFVCGGIVAAGGCTLQYILDNGGFANFDKSKIMDGAGDPIASSADATYRNATGIIEQGTGDFSSAEVGMILYIAGAFFDSPGRYEITAVGSGTVTIKSGLDTGDVGGLSVNIGGSFDKMANALSVITANDAGGKNDCYLFTNQNETDGSAMTAAGGNIEYNSKMFITGFKTTLLDMFPGGNYYQSDYDAYKDGIDADCHIKIDKNNDQSISFGVNTIFQNIRITNANVTANPAVYISSSVRGVIFNNCILDDANYLIYTEQNNTSIYFINSYLFGSADTITFIDSGNCGFYFIGCVVDMGSTDKTMFAITSTDSLVVTGCLLIGGKRIFAGGGDFTEWNNTIIGHATNTDAVHRIHVAAGLRIGFGDIVVIPQAGNVVDIASTGGSVLWNGFQALFGTDDVVYSGSYGINAKSGGQTNRMDFNSIGIDPVLDSNYKPSAIQVVQGGPKSLSETRRPLGSVEPDPVVPATPTLSLSVSGTTVTATITGATGATHYLKYKPSNQSTWLDGGSRSGDGTIAVSSLNYDVPYIFVVYSQVGSGPLSVPSPAATATLTQDPANDFDDETADGIDETLTDTGEIVTYKPNGGSERQILAVIDRDPPAPAAGSFRTAPLAVIVVKNNSTGGISSTELDTGKDKLSYAVRLGQAAKNCQISKILSQDAAALELEIR